MSPQSRVEEQESKIRRVGDRPPFLQGGDHLIQAPSGPLKVKDETDPRRKNPQVEGGGPRLGMAPEKEAELKHSSEAQKSAAEEAAKRAYERLSGTPHQFKGRQASEVIGVGQVKGVTVS